MVQPQKDQPQADNIGHRQLGIAAQLGQIAGRHRVDERHIARQQRGGAGRIVADDTVIDFRPDWFPPPIIIVAFQLDPVARLVGNELERTSADGILAAVEILGLRVRSKPVADDRHLGQVHRQQRIHAGSAQADGVGIDDLHPRDGLGVDRIQAGAVRHRRHPFQRIGYILGGEVAAVMELHRPQAKLPGMVVHLLPAFRQRRHRMGGGVHVHQTAEDMRCDRLVRGQRVVMRIDAGDRGSNADRQFLGCRRLGHRRLGHPGAGSRQPQTEDPSQRGGSAGGP